MFAPAWVKDAIFYQIFPDRFCRSGRYKAVGKFVEWGSKPTRENMFGGNLAGIEDKLEYIARFTCARFSRAIRITVTTRWIILKLTRCLARSKILIA